MNPAQKAWEFARRAFPLFGGHEMWQGHGGHGRHHWGHRGHGADEDDSPLGGGFGIRRPLRYLAHHLDLDERQVAELARILDDLKTDRAQAEVDRRRTVAAFADALAADPFNAARAAEAGDLRVKSAERLRDAVIKALQAIHGILNADQRTRLAYLIRSGTLSV
jgi:Spy/CpxP family protein refolding chaperone